jgi:hypothetical protein
MSLSDEETASEQCSRMYPPLKLNSGRMVVYTEKVLRPNPM